MTEVNIKKYTHKDFSSGLEVRWCPGCDDYAILRSVQKALPLMNRKKEDFVFVSGIGCSSRFPYYMDTFGFHGIHGRGPALATGVKLANPKLSVWQITGDGDALAIGGNHFIHVLRRNVDINILLFNNEIYGLTKGQFSPTSVLGQKTKTSPYGNIQKPFHAGELVIGAQGDFFARVPGNNPKMMTAMFVEAEKHKGTSLVEIFQNCVIFNHNAFEDMLGKEHKSDTSIHLEHGKPMIFGKNSDKGLILNGLKLEVATIGENGITEADILVHDAHDEDPTMHLMLARMDVPEFPIALGVIRSVDSATFSERIKAQTEDVKAKAKFTDLDSLFNSGETWEIK